MLTQFNELEQSRRRAQAFESNSDQSSADEGNTAAVGSLGRVAHLLETDVLSKVGAGRGLRAAHRDEANVEGKRGVGDLGLNGMRLSDLVSRRFECWVAKANTSFP